jgi:hypothetical protein
LKVITALGIKHGATHGEVKWCRGEPVLIEVGARCHGGEGAWVDVASGVYGYNQMSVTIDSYLDAAAFASIPPLVRASVSSILYLLLIIIIICQQVHPLLLLL